MNIAVIFAGGVGSRMNSSATPKQFLKLHGKEIILYVLEPFETSPLIDGIVVVSLTGWIPYLKEILHRYGFRKVRAIEEGGRTGQESIYYGLKAADRLAGGDGIVLIHDGVRPMIDHETIERNIRSVQERGNAVTTTAVTETIVSVAEDAAIEGSVSRERCRFARAPQSFYIKDILSAHEKARQEGQLNFIDSASMMLYYGKKLYTVTGPSENIKITTPYDYYMFKAYYEAKEARSILGF